MTLPHRFSPPPRPDLAARLLAAVAERDQAMAERLVQQWVHRRDLVALEALIAGPLLSSQGPEAAQWLQARSGLSSATDPESMAATLVPIQLRPELAQPAVPGNGSLAEPDDSSAPELVPASVVPAARVVPASWVWPQLSVVPGGAAAPAPRSLDLLRAWLPDADGDGEAADANGEDADHHIPLAS